MFAGLLTTRVKTLHLAIAIAVAGVLIPSLAGAAAAPREPRLVIPLGDAWCFALRPAGTGFEAAAFDDSAWEQISVPHTWNAFDAQDGGAPYARGDGWYRRTLAWNNTFAEKRVYLQFDAANRVAEVWLNGKRIGLHKGGYARFRFDISDALDQRAANILAVRVNNESNGIIPQGGDFSAFGGLYRQVSLIVVPRAHVALGDNGSAGVYLTQKRVAQDSADVEARVLVENEGATVAALQVRTIVKDDADHTVARAESILRVPARSRAEATHALRMEKPRLWDGVQAPYSYRTTVELVQAGRVVDAVVQPLGLRSFSVDPEKGLTLNGRALRLHGVNRHQDFKDRGYALTPADHELDLSFIRELGANTVRLAHYQHDDHVYDLCDRFGLVVWAELVFVGPALDTEEFALNAEQQLRELIRQNYNHPAIFFWSIGNETQSGGRTVADKVLKRLDALARKEDRTRLTTYASNHSDDDPRNFNTQVLGYNRYFGWYGGDYGEFGPFLDGFHAKHPQVCLGISEYGAGASVFQQEEQPPVRSRTQAHGPWHPEQWQRDYHESSWLTLEARPFIWGVYIWNMFDFASDGRAEGDTTGRNDKGLVTSDRLTRKDAFYWYKAHWNPEPLAYLASRRHNLRLDPLTEIRIYSNCETVEAWLNGVSLGTRPVENRRVVWAPVTLVPGPNRVYVEGRIKGKVIATDSCSWTLASGVPYRPSDAAPAPR
jgi:beta-galactosidase